MRKADGSSRTISIHAPTRGATHSWFHAIAMKLFQSTLPRGERHIKLADAQFFELFQSTLPRGERLYQGCGWIL